MKQKLIHTATLILMLLLVDILLHQVFMPHNATELALRQMNEDGSREQLRVAEQASNLITPVLIMVGIIVGLMIWRRPARTYPGQPARTPNPGPV
ncbi:MAG: hypothetical protein JW860_00020 [Sedimentisphaerales bacterium]|nr:hypothetical protein [Sedimentisphaerales bacterium]